MVKRLEVSPEVERYERLGIVEVPPEGARGQRGPARRWENDVEPAVGAAWAAAGYEPDDLRPAFTRGGPLR